MADFYLVLPENVGTTEANDNESFEQQISHDEQSLELEEESGSFVFGEDRFRQLIEKLRTENERLQNANSQLVRSQKICVKERENELKKIYEDALNKERQAMLKGRPIHQEIHTQTDSHSSEFTSSICTQTDNDHHSRNIEVQTVVDLQMVKQNSEQTQTEQDLRNTYTREFSVQTGNDLKGVLDKVTQTELCAPLNIEREFDSSIKQRQKLADEQQKVLSEARIQAEMFLQDANEAKLSLQREKQEYLEQRRQLDEVKIFLQKQEVHRKDEEEKLMRIQNELVVKRVQLDEQRGCYQRDGKDGQDDDEYEYRYEQKQH
ncbi:MAG: hypothetical protein EZS28_001910 [Streblomastix strix]|uniref:Uncharacterized protein n=1 Tax=Streblomastix strix TaxID=222440 RepID=A0A5J4X7P9_9EUKA|nr:MAG: hypothetical protein EZS28_001910 [Streblomastix strix]